MTEVETPISIWLDDLRPAPAGWTHARNVAEAVHLFEKNIVEFASLDHDLGGDGPDAIALVDWMSDNNVWPEKGVALHSMNPVGVRNMMRQIDHYGPYEAGYGTHFRGVWVEDLENELSSYPED